jgi:hypothetical protein
VPPRVGGGDWISGFGLGLGDRGERQSLVASVGCLLLGRDGRADGLPGRITTTARQIADSPRLPSAPDADEDHRTSQGSDQRNGVGVSGLAYVRSVYASMASRNSGSIARLAR